MTMDLQEHLLRRLPECAAEREIVESLSFADPSFAASFSLDAYRASQEKSSAEIRGTGKASSEPYMHMFLGRQQSAERIQAALLPVLNLRLLEKDDIPFAAPILAKAYAPKGTSQEDVNRSVTPRIEEMLYAFVSSENPSDIVVVGTGEECDTICAVHQIPQLIRTEGGIRRGEGFRAVEPERNGLGSALSVGMEIILGQVAYCQGLPIARDRTTVQPEYHCLLPNEQLIAVALTPSMR